MFDGIKDQITKSATGSMTGKLKEKLQAQLPMGQINDARKMPDKACERYNEWMLKMSDKAGKVSIPLHSLKITPQGECEATGPGVKVFDPCKYYLQGRTAAEEKLSKTSVVVFENGKCTSAVKIIEKKVMDKSKQYLPSDDVMMEAAVNGPKKACSFYDKTMNKSESAYKSVDDRLRGFVEKIPLFKKVKDFSPEMANKLLPTFGVVIADDKSCTMKNSGSFTEKIAEKLKLCEKFNKYHDKLKNTVTGKVPVKFVDGQCYQKTFVDMIKEMVGIPLSAGQSIVPSVTVVLGVLMTMMF